jgi:hypothetical protein
VIDSTRRAEPNPRDAGLDCASKRGIEETIGNGAFGKEVAVIMGVARMADEFTGARCLQREMMEGFRDRTGADQN